MFLRELIGRLVSLGMVKNMSGNMNNNDLITRQILSVIREGKNCETTLIKEEVEPQDNSFVINKDNATAQEILDLIESVKAKVKENSGVELEEEVKIIGEA